MGKFLKALFTFKWLTKLLDRFAPIVERIAKEALPLIQEVTRLTPTRSDDEIVALFIKYGVANAQAWLALPVEQRGAALLAVVTELLGRKFPQAKNVIHLAIELALLHSREGA